MIRTRQVSIEHYVTSDGQLFTDREKAIQAEITAYVDSSGYGSHYERENIAEFIATNRHELLTLLSSVDKMTSESAT